MKKNFDKYQKPFFLDINELHAIPSCYNKAYEALPPIDAINNYDDYLKKINAYENCEKNYGEDCPQPRCQYCVVHLKNGEKIWFTCGRHKDEIGW